jgi:hypothetical protein
MRERSVAYEVWDMRSGNLVASFSREEEALALVRDAVATHGEAYGRSLALIREDDDGTSTTMAVSDQLLRHVRVSV